jgi:hypothetical protein
MVKRFVIVNVKGLVTIVTDDVVDVIHSDIIKF